MVREANRDGLLNDVRVDYMIPSRATEVLTMEVNFPSIQLACRLLEEET
jgi:hypothetical protein